MEVIKEVFSVIKLAKIVKTTFAKTFIYSYGFFGRDFKGNSTQLKKIGSRWLLQIIFHRCSYQVLTHRCVSIDSAPRKLKENALGR